MSPYIIPGVKTIEDIACEIWQIPKESLYVKTRKREVVEARQVLMAYGKQKTGNSFAKVGKGFNKDHATVIHSVKTVKNLRETNKAFRDKYDTFIDIANKLTPTK